ncbi:MAG: Brp/Blh family beta-carotene 15,15'-monooxygenase [Glaciecola sp.]
MNKLNYTQLYLYAFLLAILSLFINLDQYTDYFLVLLALAVITLGLPHGALDFGVAKSLKLVNSITSTICFVIIYLIVTVLAIAFWIWQPSIALVIFLAISIVHFSADWRESTSRVVRISLAAMIICGPSLIHASLVTAIFTDLLLPFNHAAWVVLGMRAVTIVSILLLLSFTVYAILQKKHTGPWQLAEWSTLLVSSVVLTPLLHFGLYFCVLHSPKHLYDVSGLLNTSVKRAVMLSLPFVLLTLLLATGFYVWLGSGVLSVDLLRWIFIGLFGLTTSHMILISVWHKSQ